MRCAAHDLAAGPEGFCALCLRERHSLAVGRAKRAGRGILCSLFGLSAALLAAYGLRRALPVPVPVSAEAPAARGLPSPARVAEQVRPEQAAGAAHVLPPVPSEAVPGTSAPVRAQPSADEPAAPAALRRAPSGAELQAALRATPVTLFSASWCPACKQAKAFLAQNGISYQNRDVDEDADARAELKRRTGETKIPLLVIDGEQLSVGFDSEAMARSLTHSLERRLGVTGLSLSVARTHG